MQTEILHWSFGKGRRIQSQEDRLQMAKIQYVYEVTRIYTICNEYAMNHWCLDSTSKDGGAVKILLRIVANGFFS